MFFSRDHIAARLAALVLLVAPSPALAAWPHEPDASGVPLRLAFNLTALAPSAVRDGAGGVIVAWSEGGNLFAQRVDANGTRLWGSGAVSVCTAIGAQVDPVVSEDGAGGCVIAWEDPRSGIADVYVQRLNSSGTPQWAPDGVALCTATGAQGDLQIVSDGSSGAIVAWLDPRAGNPDVYARRVSGAGAAIGTADGYAICTDVDIQGDLAMTRDANGHALIVWMDQRLDGGDIYYNRFTNGSLVQMPNGLVACNAIGTQSDPVITPDGDTGALIAWVDGRAGGGDLYMQKMTGAGGRVWTADGVELCAAAGAVSGLALVGDGLGGGIVAWSDTRAGAADIYTRRIDATGAPMWTADGVALCTASYSQGTPEIVADAVGGAIVAWSDARTGTGYADLYAQRISASGGVAWATNGLALSTAPLAQGQHGLVSDDRGGAIVAFNDDRMLLGATGDVNAVQRVDEWGMLGAEPVIASVTDLPNDQGGQVKVSWLASPLDTDPLYRNIFEYQVYRSAPPLLVERALRAGRVSDDSDEVSTAPGTLLARAFGAQTSYWELLGVQAAIHLPTYSFVAATTGDSIPGSNPQTAFLVLARTSGSTRWWWSVPDSGYSVDNLAPATPAPFTGQYQGAITRLHWNPNTEPDLAGYRLYRGSSATFVPDASNRIASPPDTGWVDAAGGPYVYKLTAIDVHGNESLVATLTPAGTLDAPNTPSAALFLATPAPNPARGGNAALVRFGLPSAGRVSLSLHDLQGRRVSVALDGELPAGEHRVRLDGRSDTGGVLAPGLYLVRLVTTAGERTARLAILD